MDESKAIAACKQHDPKSQKILFDTYSEGMLLICMRYVKHQPDAEEVLLNGFYKFFNTIDRFIYTGKGSIGGWLKKIMINECLMFLRKGNAFSIVQEEYALEIAETSFASAISATEIFRYITRLPTGYRTVFNLYVVEGYSHKEIADLLDISEGTSKSQLNKARIMLQKMILKEGTYHEK